MPRATFQDPLRDRAKKEEVSEQALSVTPEPDTAPKKKRRMGWAELLARVFTIDIRPVRSAVVNSR